MVPTILVFLCFLAHTSIYRQVLGWPKSSFGYVWPNFLANPIHLAYIHLYSHPTPAKKKKKEACPFLPRNQTSRDYLVCVAPGFSQLSFRLSAFFFVLPLFKALSPTPPHSEDMHTIYILPTSTPHSELKAFLTIGPYDTASDICKYLLVSLLSGL